jgi:cytochrome d ubiquinol oxidase subunit I
MPLIAGYAHCYDGSKSNFPVSDFLLARSQMGMSLAFHIVFAAIGISLPVWMVVSEALYRRTGRPVFLELAKRWSRGAAILFAVGAVSGTVLSFELGLLWPSLFFLFRVFKGKES